jgi:hypothetical protein
MKVISIYVELRETPQLGIYIKSAGSVLLLIPLAEAFALPIVVERATMKPTLI